MPVKIKITEQDEKSLELVRDLITQDMKVHYTIPFLAAKSGLNEFKLKIGFKQLFGLAIFEFLREQRMQLAKMLLDTTDRNLGDIGMACGFHQHTNFTAAFKRQFNITPKEYRDIKIKMQNGPLPPDPVHLSQADRENLQWIKELILKDVTAHYTYSWLSKRVKINQFKLKVGFKWLYGHTIYDLLESERLKLAIQLLDTTNDSINLISEKCGYMHPTNFIAAFKRHIKLTPAKYKRSIGQLNKESSTVAGRSPKKKLILNAGDVDRVNKAASIIRLSLTKHISIKELAKRTKLTEAKLMLGFKEQMGMSVYGFLRFHRMERAKEMIAKNISMPNILREVGYQREKDFEVAFKKVYNQSPAAWKQTLQLSRAS